VNTYYVALQLNLDDCIPTNILVHEDLRSLQIACDKTSRTQFRWASCPGGRDPECPDDMTPVAYSLDLRTGEERSWEIFKSEIL